VAEEDMAMPSWEEARQGAPAEPGAVPSADEVAAAETTAFETVPSEVFVPEVLSAEVLSAEPAPDPSAEQPSTDVPLPEQPPAVVEVPNAEHPTVEVPASFVGAGWSEPRKTDQQGSADRGRRAAGGGDKSVLVGVFAFSGSDSETTTADDTDVTTRDQCAC
jgi:hypothetical protein